MNLLIDEFFDNFTSEHTRLNYRSDLNLFLKFAQQEFKLDLLSVEREHIIKYRNWLSEVGGQKQVGHAPKSIARKLAALSSYFDFLVEKGQRQFNPASSVKRPRLDVRSPTQALTKDQVREILALIDKTKLSGALHSAMLMLFFTSGLRKSEVLSLRYKDYREINEHKVIEFVGKGGKIGQKLVHPEAVEAIEHYLSLMGASGRSHQREDWLFQPSHNPTNPQNLNKPLNPRTLNEILSQYAKVLGLNFSVTPHSARATFIGELLELGIDIYTVAREVNHSSVKTTQEYDKRRKKLSDSPVYKLKY